ncbi:MAG: aromatic ring-hydroxylating dioxygenase subunit alpha [Arenicella sp.]|nr:aromatic ring-hydroxylating dioxygenase subunit alpha [Arenicella sp.]
MNYNEEHLAKLVHDTKAHKSVYTDAGVFDVEMQKLWGKSWIFVGHESQVAQRGDFYSFDFIGNPAVMVRDKNNQVQVLHNRCGHKGTKLVNKSCGQNSRFVCPYHGWTYSLDGKLVGVPHQAGYANTGFDKGDAQYSMKAFRSEQYRGFVFATLSSEMVDLKEWLGAAAITIDNLCDRAPQGEVEVAGGVLKFEHNCNWKLFTENLNDTMHPMVVHKSVVDSAKKYIATLPEDSPNRAEAEIIPPFGASYEVFESSGITGFAYGHHYDGGKISIHADYSVDPQYKQAMLDSYGEERTDAILSYNSHNTLYYPSVTFKSAVQNIRVVRPISVDKTIIETWSFRLKGAPESMLRRTLLYSRLINSNGSMVGADDLAVYLRAQQGMLSSASDWVEFHRNFGSDKQLDDRRTNVGTSDLDVRTQFRAWKHYMVGATL